MRNWLYVPLRHFRWIFWAIVQIKFNSIINSSIKHRTQGWSSNCHDCINSTNKQAISPKQAPLGPTSGLKTIHSSCQMLTENLGLKYRVVEKESTRHIVFYNFRQLIAAIKIKKGFRMHKVDSETYQGLLNRSCEVLAHVFEYKIFKGM